MVPDPRPGKEGEYKEFFHYLTIADCKKPDGTVAKVILDPERQKSKESKAIKKEKDAAEKEGREKPDIKGAIAKGQETYTKYMDTLLIVMNLPEEFVQNKTGRNGLGTPIKAIDSEKLFTKHVKEVGHVVTDPDLTKQFEDHSITLSFEDARKLARGEDVTGKFEDAKRAVDSLTTEKIIEEEKRENPDDQ